MRPRCQQGYTERPGISKGNRARECVCNRIPGGQEQQFKNMYVARFLKGVRNSFPYIMLFTNSKVHRLM